jgi:hypothetical protein
MTETTLWQQVKEFAWVPAGWALGKIPLTLKRISPLETQLNSTEARGRYSAGGNVVWLAWPTSNAETWPGKLNSLLTRLELSGLVLLGPPGPVRLGVNPGAPFARRLNRRLIPRTVFNYNVKNENHFLKPFIIAIHNSQFTIMQVIKGLSSMPTTFLLKSLVLKAR